MLRLLHIENIAVIEQAEIAFGDGFHAMTGETGAGKSIVIDAMGAVLGGRTSRDLIWAHLWARQWYWYSTPKIK